MKGFLIYAFLATFSLSQISQRTSIQVLAAVARNKGLASLPTRLHQVENISGRQLDGCLLLLLRILLARINSPWKACSFTYPPLLGALLKATNYLYQYSIMYFNAWTKYYHFKGKRKVILRVSTIISIIIIIIIIKRRFSSECQLQVKSFKTSWQTFLLPPTWLKYSSSELKLWKDLIIFPQKSVRLIEIYSFFLSMTFWTWPVFTLWRRQSNNQESDRGLLSNLEITI